MTRPAPRLEEEGGPRREMAVLRGDQDDPHDDREDVPAVADERTDRWVAGSVSGGAGLFLRPLVAIWATTPSAANAMAPSSIPHQSLVVTTLRSSERSSAVIRSTRPGGCGRRRVLGQLEEHRLQARPLLAQAVQLDAGLPGGVPDLRRRRAGHLQAAGDGGHGQPQRRQGPRQRLGRRGLDDDGGDALAAQLVERALVDEAAARHDDHAVHRLLHLGEDVAGDQHGAPLVAGEVAQEPAQPHDPLGVEAVGGLVEDEDARIAEQRGGQRQPLAHAQGEPLHRLPGQQPTVRPGRAPRRRVRRSTPAAAAYTRRWLSAERAG